MILRITLDIIVRLIVAGLSLIGLIMSAYESMDSKGWKAVRDTTRAILCFISFWAVLLIT